MIVKDIKGNDIDISKIRNIEYLGSDYIYPHWGWWLFWLIFLWPVMFVLFFMRDKYYNCKVDGTVRWFGEDNWSIVKEKACG